MVVDNKKTVITLQLRKLLLLFLLSVTVVLLFYIDLFNFNQNYLVIALISLYTVYYIWGLVRRYHYFYYSDLSPTKLVFRFYSLAPLSKRQNSIEIRKDEFFKFSIQKRWLGLRKELILYTQTPKGIAKFKPISISLLSKTQVQDLSLALSYFLREN
jgi:hypothetical protein